MTTTRRSKPTRRMAVTAVALGTFVAGAFPAAALAPDWLTWGLNTNGQLCDTTLTNRTTPVFPGVAPGTNFVSVAGGGASSYAVTSTGAVFSCGSNANGQLGDGTTTQRTAPVAVSLPVGVVAKSVCAGTSFAAVVTAAGDVYAWGLNSSGQLGDTTTTQRLTPVLSIFPGGTTITGIACGFAHMLAFADDGTLFAWGSDGQGQLGNGAGVTNTSTPSLVTTLPGGPGAIVDVAADGNHSVAADDNGVVYAWGADGNGAVCVAGGADQHLPLIVTLPGGATSMRVGAGRLTTFFVTSTGTVLGCGENNNGELGDGTLTLRTTPTLAILPVGTVVVDADGGSDHSLFLTNAGKILATGYNAFGQLGDGTTTQRTTPVLSLVGAGTTLNYMSAGLNHSMAAGTFSVTGVPLANRLMVTGGLAVLLVVAGAVGWRARGRRQGMLPAMG